MKIIKYKKMGNDKYKIFLDNKKEIILYEEVILKNNLLFIKEIDSNLYDKLVSENDIYKVYNDCIKYISVRIRSIKEIRNYLLKKGIDNNLTEDTIDKLIKNNYLSDEIFTKYFIMDKVNLTNDGPYKIINYLKDNDIDLELINKHLNTYEEVFKEKIDKLITKYIKLNKTYSGIILKTKIYNNLINLGYDKSIVISKLNNYNFSSGDIEKIYNSLYKKYKDKYDNDKLMSIIKQKLYQKGYTIEDISKYVN